MELPEEPEKEEPEPEEAVKAYEVKINSIEEHPIVIALVGAVLVLVACLGGFFRWKKNRRGE